MASGIVKIIAILSLKSERDGGRRTPIFSGYKTDLKYIGGQYRIVAIELDDGILHPGAVGLVMCHVLLHSEHEIDNLLDLGCTTISDGATVIGDVQFQRVVGRDRIDWTD